MRRSLLVVFAVTCLVQLGAGRQSPAQTYISAVGNPSFGVNIPVPNGYINVANGNLHMEIPLATHKQRGALQLNERLVYDSRLWEIVHYSGYYWWPINIPNSSAGWRFIKGNESGAVGTAGTTSQQLSCTGSTGGLTASPEGASPQYSPTQTYYYYAETTYYNWADPSGTVHPFDTGWHSVDPIPSQCTRAGGGSSNPTPQTTTGYATDASGYTVTMTGTSNTLPTSITVRDNSGNQVYPQVIDRFGNFWTNDVNGNLVDDLGRTPVIVTKNGTVTYYDVLAPNGPISNNGTRVRYTVTTGQVTINTAFNQSGVTEYQNNNGQSATIPTIQSVGLPDGSSYQFSYDSYGEVQSMTLPTGGVVNYGWANYTDSYQNVNRWLSSSTIAGSTTNYTPSVVTQCASNGTGCQESVNVHRPSGDETVYTMTLDNGAWDTNTTVYSGAASTNQAKLATVTSYDFSQACTTPGCNGAQNVTKTYETNSLPDAHLSSQTQTVFGNPKTGHLTSILQWDFYPTGSTPSSLPTRQINYGYTNFDLTSETHLDSSGNTAASKTYNFTTTAAATSGVVGHGAANAGGPYLTSVVAVNNAPAGSVTSSSSYEDTGEMLTTTDADQHPATTYKHDLTHTFVIEVDRPNTTTNGTTFSHVSKASFDPNSGAILSSDDENSVANGQAYTIRYTYESSAGRLQKVAYPGGGSMTYTWPSYTETDTIVAQTSSVNITTSHIADAYGRNYQTTVGGITTTHTYDGNGRLYSVTNPQAATASTTDGTTYTYYDALDRATSVTNPDGSSRTLLIVGNAAVSTDEVGFQNRQLFNAFGELTSVFEPDPGSGTLTLETDYQRDSLGNVTCLEQHGGVSGTGCSSPATSDATSPWRVRRFFYNQLSQLRAASIPEHTTPGSSTRQNCGPGTGTAQWTDCYNYDPNGNTTSTVDNRGVTRTYTFDVLNRPLIKTSPNGTTEDLWYDGGSLAQNAVGRLWHESNDANAASTYAYDTLGRLLSESSCRPSNCPGGGYVLTSGTYDLAGNRTSITYPDGRVIGNGYDTLNRLSTVTYKSWGTQPVGTTYWSAAAYAPPGELATANYSNGMQMQVGLNARQSITSLSYKSTSPTSPPTYFNKTYLWDKNAANLLNETDQTTSKGRQYGYDRMNRLVSAVDVTTTAAKATGTATITGAEGSSTTCGGGGLTTNAVSSSQSTTAPNTSPCTTIYDTGNVSISVGSFTVSTSYQKLSTSAKLATSLAALLNGSGSPVTATVSGTAITMTAVASGSSANYALSYSSDGDFNATFSGATLTGGTTATPVSGGFNQAYTLDAWGNLSSMGSSGFNQATNVANQISAYRYDAAGRLLGDGTYGTNYTYDDDGMMLSSPEGTTYIYDALGQRAQVANSGTSKEYYYFGGQLIATVNPGTGAWTDMIYAGGRIAEVAGAQTATPVYAIVDYLGSEVGSVGATTTSLDYAPFGQKLSGSNPDSFIFTGLEHDVSGLDHAGFRQYSSAEGRWITPDPYDGSYNFGDPQSFNRYSYVGNRPRRYADPSGQVPCVPTDVTVVGGVYTMVACASTVAAEAAGVTLSNLIPIVGEIVDIGFGAYELGHLLGWWGHPAFHGNLRGQQQRQNVRSNNAGQAKACETSILNATNNQFGTTFNSDNVTGEFQYSTGAPAGQGTLNLDITGTQAADVSAGRYPLHWWTYIIGYGSTLHVPSGAGGSDSPLTLTQTSNQFTAHLDSAYPYGVGFAFHYLLDMKGLGGYQPCP